MNEGGAVGEGAGEEQSQQREYEAQRRAGEFEGQREASVGSTVNTGASGEQGDQRGDLGQEEGYRPQHTV